MSEVKKMGFPKCQKEHHLILAKSLQIKKKTLKSYLDSPNSLFGLNLNTFQRPF
jgi:hypothetical protein